MRLLLERVTAELASPGFLNSKVWRECTVLEISEPSIAEINHMLSSPPERLSELYVEIYPGRAEDLEQFFINITNITTLDKIDLVLVSVDTDDVEEANDLLRGMLIKYAPSIHCRRLTCFEFNLLPCISELIKSLVNVAYIDLVMDDSLLEEHHIAAITAARKENPNIEAIAISHESIEAYMASPPIFSADMLRLDEQCIVAAMHPESRGQIIRHASSLATKEIALLPVNTGNGVPPALVIPMTTSNPKLAIRFFKPDTIASARSKDNNTFLHAIATTHNGIDDEVQAYVDNLLASSRAKKARM